MSSPPGEQRVPVIPAASNDCDRVVSTPTELSIPFEILDRRAQIASPAAPTATRNTNWPSGAGKESSGHFFTGDLDANRVPGFRVGTIEEEVDAAEVPIDEARGFESRFGRLQICKHDLY